MCSLEPAPDALPREARDRLVRFVRAEQREGRLKLTRPDPTPQGWRLRNTLHMIGVPIALLAAIYTSEFLSRTARSKIKPVVELMASSP